MLRFLRLHWGKEKAICNHTHKAIRKATRVLLNSQSLYAFGWLSKALRNRRTIKGNYENRLEKRTWKLKRRLMGLVQPINSHFRKSWICQIMHLTKTHQWWKKKASEWCQSGPTSKLDSNSRISLFDLELYASFITLKRLELKI